MVPSLGRRGQRNRVPPSRTPDRRQRHLLAGRTNNLIPCWIVNRANPAMITLVCIVRKPSATCPQLETVTRCELEVVRRNAGSTFSVIWRLEGQSIEDGRHQLSRPLQLVRETTKKKENRIACSFTFFFIIRFPTRFFFFPVSANGLFGAGRVRCPGKIVNEKKRRMKRNEMKFPAKK